MEGFFELPKSMIEYSIPCNLYAEFDVLKGILEYPQSHDLIFKDVSEESFYSDDCKALFLEALNLRKLEALPAYTTILNNAVLNGNTNLVDLLNKLTLTIDKTLSEKNLVDSIEILKDSLLKRNAQKVALKYISELVSSSDVYGSVKNIQSELSELSTQSEEPSSDLESTLVDIQKRITDVYEGVETKSEVNFSTGLKAVDDIILGYQPAKLYIIAARPAMGKTSFVLNSIFNCVEKDEPFLICSLEMPLKEMALKLVSAKTGFTSYAYKTGYVPNEIKGQHLGIQSKIEYIKEKPISIKDKNCYTVDQIKSLILETIDKYGKISGLAIDYLQLMDGDSKEGREKEISKISRSLKRLAKEFNIPVIALSQLSRTVEARQNKRPMLSDLRESGAIEQDADVVMFIYRDEYYNPESDMKDESEIIIAKQRDGPVGTAFVRFDKKTITFEDKGI